MPLLALFAPGPATAGTTKARLGEAKARLAALESAIQAEDAQLASLQSLMNSLAAKVEMATSAYQQTEQTAMDTRSTYQQVQDRYESLRATLDQRAADAYMEGPGTGLDAVLGSASLVEFSDRLQFLNSVAEHDSTLADNVQGLADQVRARERALNGVLAQQAAAVRQYDAAQSRLNGSFRQEQSLRHDLEHKQASLESLVGKLQQKLDAAARARAKALSAAAGNPVNIKDNPFHVCPVGQPHAFDDSFGQPRYTTTPPHPHAGNDIMAPRGTPIYAPFDGVATDASGGLGGMAVIVTGADGYTYNAHIEAFGTLGAVKAGTVVGYVGNTGDAAGGATHDHFEWHPNVPPSPPYTSPYGYTDVNGAIDPYPYLIQVC